MFTQVIFLALWRVAFYSTPPLTRCNNYQTDHDDFSNKLENDDGSGAHFHFSGDKYDVLDTAVDILLFSFSLSNFSCLKTGTVPVSFSGEFLTETYYVVSSIELFRLNGFDFRKEKSNKQH